MTLGMEVGLSPVDFVLDGDAASLPKKGAEPPPNFGPMSIMAKWLDGSRWHLAWRWALVSWSLTSLFSTNMAMSETRWALVQATLC